MCYFLTFVEIPYNSRYVLDFLYIILENRILHQLSVRYDSLA
jgi:hypothetical protein